MLLARIQQDLFDFVDLDPDDFDGLLEFWYRANSAALSAALTAQPGLSLILNVSSFQSFESLAKKLFLIADTLVLRDTRQWTDEELGFQYIPVPTDGYRPGFMSEVGEELDKLRPSPMTLLYQPALYWSSTTKTLNNGYHIAYAGWGYNKIPKQFAEWISGSGRSYMQSGQVIYAPFIPSLDMELEFLKSGIAMPDYFNATPCFHQNYEWLSQDRLQAVLSLKVPFLDGIDISTISEVKKDHHDEFMAFSRDLLDAINGMKATCDSEGFMREVRYIQRNKIDAALADVQKALKRIGEMRSLRRAGLLTGLLGLNGAAYIGVPEASLITGLATSGAALVMEKVTQLREQGELKDKKGYFLWRLQELSS